jgi:hypothetical protein
MSSFVGSSILGLFFLVLSRYHTKGLSPYHLLSIGHPPASMIGCSHSIIIASSSSASSSSVLDASYRTLVWERYNEWFSRGFVRDWD